MTNIIVMMSAKYTHTHTQYSYCCLTFLCTWQLKTISADFPLVDSPICCTDVLQSVIVSQHLYCSGQSPGRCSRYWTHLFPNSRWSLRMMASSLGDHGPCLICGLRWFRYLSRHCLPVRGAILAPMVDLIYSTCAVRSIILFYVMVMRSLPVSIRIMSLY